ncbi:MAG: DUF1800 domain-containing protein [Alphaproteobacteria bacterium]|nr:DUF1800 domain-containing protein [Alphaproteobacteria bacterium]
MAALSAHARVAANRFGMGLRPEEIEGLSSGNPRAWLLSQLSSPQPAPVSSLEGSPIRRLAEGEKNKDKDAQKAIRREIRQQFTGMLGRKFTHAITTKTSFHERLVWFWENHFSVSTKSPIATASIIGYEALAIRPHVTGKFEDMLIAVAQHPAMLLYLDNTRSISADSMAGKRQKKGLNENLAREILELHTLGVEGGYSQADVGALAKLITGWSIDRESGNFQFRPLAHSREDVTLLNKRYSAPRMPNVERGEAALRDLARHPATAQFIALKLARHFIADIPPESAVNALRDAFLRSGGDLRQVYEALLGLPEAWQPAPVKLKSSSEMIISAARLTGVDDAPRRYLEFSLRELKNTPYSALSPAGFPDTASELLGSDMLLRRIQWAEEAARMLTKEEAPPPDSAAYITFGETLHPDTVQAIANARDRQTAYAILFASPEFQRR